MSYDRWIEGNTVFEEYEIPYSYIEARKLCEFIIDNNYKKYGYLSLLGIILRGWLGMGYVKIGQDETERYICSELMYRALKKTLQLECIEDVDYLTVEEFKEIGTKNLKRIK